METPPEDQPWSRRLKRLGGFIAGLGLATIAVNLLPGLESAVAGELGAIALIGGSALAGVGIISEGVPTTPEAP